jgi:integrase
MSENLRHKTAVIIGTVTSVPGYPKKLKVYLNNASPYWQAVYWDKGKTYRQTMKTTDKLVAYESAKVFYEMLILKKYQHQAHITQHVSSDANKPVKTKQPYHSFKKIATQWLALQAVKWSPRHKDIVEKRLANNMYRYVANKNIQLITKSELLGLLKKMEARGAYDLVRRLLSDCRQIWQYAMLLDICKLDITVGLGAALHGHIVVHQKAVAIKELPDLMNAIATYDKTGDRICCYALQLIALTFVRKSELTHAKWHEFDLDEALWKIPAERMKMRVEHVVPLSKQVLGLLRFLKQTYPSDCYVINNGNANVLIPDNALMQALYWMGYKNRMTAHGFRAIASTVLNEHEFRGDVIESQLAHVEPNAVRRAYNRAQYMNERIEMMSWWGDYLEKITPFNTPQI